MIAQSRSSGADDRNDGGEGRRPRATAGLVAALAAGVFAFLCFSPQLFNDGDTSWHLAAGRWILAAGAVPDADPFSFTAPGRAWVAHEWLAEVLMVCVFRLGSWAGLSLLFSGAIAALLLMIGLEARRRLSSPLALTCLLLALFVLLSPFMLARPHVLAWPVLAGWTILLLRARDAGRAPPLAAALVMLVWANLHASFLFGLLLIGPFALEALIEGPDRPKVVRQWGLFGILSLLLSLATPHGIHGLLYPIEVSAMASLPLILEWRPTVAGEMMSFEIVLLGALFFALLKGLRLPIVRLILLLGLLYLAFEHIRHQAVLGIVGALLLIRAIALATGSAEERLERPSRRSVAAFLLLLLLIAATRVALPMPRQDSASNPVTALAKLPPQLRGQPVLNSYGFGGPLILEGIRPFIDGRADMYGDALVFEHQRIVEGDMAAFRRAAARWGIGWTMIAPDAPLVARLDREPGWRRLYADPWAVIHVRTAGGGGRPSAPPSSSSEAG